MSQVKISEAIRELLGPPTQISVPLYDGLMDQPEPVLPPGVSIRETMDGGYVEPLDLTIRKAIGADPLFEEDKIVSDLITYIAKTYKGHYAAGRSTRAKRQVLESIIDSGHGLGFTIGNGIKYLGRAGHKGGVEGRKSDLMKAAHYCILALYIHELESLNER